MPDPSAPPPPAPAAPPPPPEDRLVRTVHAAVVDRLAGDLVATRVLAAAFLVAGALTAVGHLVAIVASSRLR